MCQWAELMYFTVINSLNIMTGIEERKNIQWDGLMVGLVPWKNEQNCSSVCGDDCAAARGLCLHAGAGHTVITVM